jgi:hypothetical protein
MGIPEITFPRGSGLLNADPNFSFQLNRVIQWNGGRLQDIVPVSPNGAGYGGGLADRLK